MRFPMKVLAKLVDGIFKKLLDMIVEFTFDSVPRTVTVVNVGASDEVPHNHV